ncbi:D-glycero-beta-D-manno-heptose-7-phosphate kinase [Sutterella sp.]|uniref:D-glycero-beta-D-manno-heptose-7-phosphate kinase n=1 Tax=Sutterella sp. TaxID=1981025 RepID=UPI0026DEC208|nr:D-glycero-beta-D-manno-heptose-7-phosphate kinase [Sutterella sp.]MDO5531040.1 D-glycero-beta-D-manno-heptose-7-phosphate kinase [Sutterella sp.]
MDRTLLKNARVLVAGDAMLDRYWFGDVDRISPEAPVPVVNVVRTEERLGGAANVARSIAAVGASSTLLSVVGGDEAGRSIERLLIAEGITPKLEFDDALKTTVKLRVVARQQQLVRCDFEAAPGEECLKRHLGLFTELMRTNEALVLSDYGKGGLSHIIAMIAGARAAQIPILIDPKGDDYSRYRGATVITPNRSELRQVIGSWSSEEALIERAQNLRRELDLQYLLLTRSEEGMTLFGPDGQLNVPAQAREVYDVSGAGDTVIGILAAMLATGMPIEEAVPIANRAGGIVVGKLGTASVSYEELFGE